MSEKVLPEPMSQPPPTLQAKIDKYKREHEAAYEIFLKKEKDYPMLVKPVVVKPPEKKKRITYERIERAVITKEKITDDQGRDIVFHRPNGDRIARKVPLFFEPFAQEVKTGRVRIKPRNQETRTENDAATARHASAMSSARRSIIGSVSGE